MSFGTLDALRESLAQPAAGPRSPAYVAKMLHAVPAATVVDRIAFFLDRCRGQRVVEFGASGPLHERIRVAASQYLGVDREAAEDVIAFDLDDVSCAYLPSLFGAPPDVIVCGEILEHLSNPGWFLTRARAQWPGLPLLISVPNAFSAVAARRLLVDGVENVNVDHVCWYSHRTLLTLLTRAGYEVAAFHWYTGDPFTAEGLIMVTR